MSPKTIEIISWSIVLFLIAIEVLAILTVYRVFARGQLQGLLMDDDNSKASLARLQALIFTFVVAGLFMVFSVDIGDFVEIPESVLGLLGISGGTYLVSKGISKSDTTAPNDPPVNPSTNPPTNPPANPPKAPNPGPNI